MNEYQKGFSEAFVKEALSVLRGIGGAAEAFQKAVPAVNQNAIKSLRQVYGGAAGLGKGMRGIGGISNANRGIAPSWWSRAKQYGQTGWDWAKNNPRKAGAIGVAGIGIPAAGMMMGGGDEQYPYDMDYGQQYGGGYGGGYGNPYMSPGMMMNQPQMQYGGFNPYLAGGMGSGGFHPYFVQ